MEQRAPTRRGVAGRGPGIAQASLPLVSPLVTSFAGVGSGVIKRQAPRARGVQGHGRVRRRARGTQNDRASRGYSPIDPKNAAVSALVIARRKRRDSARKQKRTSRSRAVTMSYAEPRSSTLDRPDSRITSSKYIKKIYINCVYNILIK